MRNLACLITTLGVGLPSVFTLQPCYMNSGPDSRSSWTSWTSWILYRIHTNILETGYRHLHGLYRILPGHRGRPASAHTEQSSPTSTSITILLPATAAIKTPVPTHHPHSIALVLQPRNRTPEALHQHAKLSRNRPIPATTHPAPQQSPLLPTTTNKPLLHLLAHLQWHRRRAPPLTEKPLPACDAPRALRRRAGVRRIE